jgi:hypothetical protein
LWGLVWQLAVLDERRNKKFEEVQRQVVQSGSLYWLYTIWKQHEGAVRLHSFHCTHAIEWDQVALCCWPPLKLLPPLGCAGCCLPLQSESLVAICVEVFVGVFSYNTMAWALQQGATSHAFLDALICIGYLDNMVGVHGCSQRLSLNGWWACGL